jgi:signal transduction histidine kinase/DNA-binding response OmpR family regulator
MTAPHELTRQAARLTRLYILALAAVACLSILGQLLVQWSLRRQQSDSTIVNLAGRQRMLSQRLVKATLKLERTSQPDELTAGRREIAAALAEWRQSAAGLKSGDAGLGLPGKNSPVLQQMLTEIEPHFQSMAQAAEQLLTNAGESPAALEQLIAHEPQFLSAMDAIVRQYELEARSRVMRLQVIERSLLGLTLLVLICEGALIFRPAIRRLRLAAIAMEKSSEQLEIAKQQADSASAAKSQFLATISHELRNPLQAILGSVELATKNLAQNREGEAPAEPQSLEHLETISVAARTLLTLLNDLLDLARIEAGKLAIVTAPLDPLRLTERTLAMVKPQALAQGLRLDWQSPDPFPSCLGDEIRIQQVLLNLLTNALKFTPSGAIHVRLSERSTGSQSPLLRWEVRDTGIGIPRDQQTAIFTTFNQLAPAASRKSGAGLGLAICHRLVELMHGQIGVASEPGAGSLFWFELPLVQPHDAEPSHDEKLPASRPSAPFRVLLVDDDPVNRRLLAQMIESLGHQVIAASTGHEAIARFRESEIDLAILDWQLPDLNGGQLASALRSLEPQLSRPQVPFIALSAALEDSSQARQKSTIFDQWLTKPIGLAELAAALSRTNPPQRNVAEPRERWTAALARLNNRREVFSQIAHSYRAGLPELLANLHTAVSEQRTSEVARLAHLLAGQASCFGAHELASSAQSIEATAQHVLPDPALLAKLAAHANQLATDLETWSTESDNIPAFH